MPNIQRMLSTHPQKVRVSTEALGIAAQACLDCAAHCTACADACLAEDKVRDLVRCIRLNLDCADVCLATARMTLRQTLPDWTLLAAQLEACTSLCEDCHQECDRHAGMHEHCKLCAESCRNCAEACGRLLEALPSDVEEI